MKKHVFAVLTTSIIATMCMGVWWDNQSHSFETLSSIAMADILGGCDGCYTSSTSCGDGPCYLKTAGYYMKVGTGNTVEICKSGLTGGCDFGGEYVPCHTIKSGCGDDLCREGCTTTMDYGRSECSPL